MSTNVEHARPNRTDTPTRTGADADPTTTAGDGASTTPDPSTTGREPLPDSSPETPSPHIEPDDWTQRCQRQFDSRATDRLANLVDESNLVVVSPGDE
ncbi:MAG: hypothetical protein ABEJ97_00325 [Halobellus sp.]